MDTDPFMDQVSHHHSSVTSLQRTFLERVSFLKYLQEKEGDHPGIVYKRTIVYTL